MVRPTPQPPCRLCIWVGENPHPTGGLICQYEKSARYHLRVGDSETCHFWAGATGALIAAEVLASLTELDEQENHGT